MNKGLTLRNITISQGGKRLLQLDDFVAPGEILTVMGPSGSGKSTLLAFITGSLAPGFETKGEVWLDGMDITNAPPDKRKIGILFQDDLLFPHLSVGANLAFGLEAGGTRAQRQQKVEDALESIGLGGFANRDPATLSGGQRVRVSLMRMLLSGPCALLLDEPFSKLDADRRAQIRALVFDLAKKKDLPVVLVTHDIADATAAGGKTLTLTV